MRESKWDLPSSGLPPNGYKAEARSWELLWISHMVQGPKHVGHLPLLSQVHLQGAASEMEQPGLELAAIEDTGITGGSFTQHNSDT